MFPELGHWFPIVDGDPRARAMLDHHYSGRKTRSLNGQVMPPGEWLLLMTTDSRAVFGWVHNLVERYDKQEGICCTVFRNEGAVLSSDLVREADELADARWGALRHFTYVDPNKVNSPNPGYCFIAAGWRPCGYSKKGLRILERLP